MLLSQIVEIDNPSGRTLSGVIEWPASGEVQAYALFAHCFTCGKDSHAAQNISRLLAARGIAVLRFDFTGIGDSEGLFEDTNFSGNVEDLLAFIDYLIEEDMTPQLLIGHSLGGAAVLAAAAQREEIKAVATIGAPATPAHVAHLLPDELDELGEDDVVEVQLGINKMKLKKQFLEDIKNQNTAELLFGLNKAVLIAHSPEDEVVDIKNAEEIFKSLHHPKSFLSLDGMSHLILKKEQARYIANVIYEWAKRYVDVIEIPEIDGEHGVSGVLHAENYTTEIVAGEHALIADEPIALGGKNLGPSPYQFVSAGLAACTAMTIRMYVNHKGWEVGRIKVTVNHQKKETVNADGKKSKIDSFERTVWVEGNVSDDQKQRILKIANKCPVHRTLMGEVEIPSMYEGLE